MPNEELSLPHAGFGFDPNDKLHDLRISAKGLALLERVKQFIAETAAPAAAKFHELGHGRADRWVYAPGQLDVLGEAKAKA